MIALEPVIAARLLLRAAENVGHDFHGNQWTSYYHGTSEDSVSTILSEGLRPQKGAHKVFMTSDISEAKGFANNHKLGALLEIRVPKSVSVEKLAYNQAAHTAIPREWIRVHSTVKDNPASTGPSRVWRGAGDVEGHDFHGNQWSSRPLTLPEKRTIGNWQLTDRIDAKTRREMRELLKDASTTGSLARFRPETGITVWRGQDQVELQTGPRSFSTSEKDAKGWGKYVHPLVITDDTLALDLDRIKGKGQSEREVIVDVKKIKTLEEVGHDFHGNQYSQYGSRLKLNPVTFFHGTSTAALAAIKKEGLRPVAGKGADAWAAANRWDSHIIDEVKTEIGGRKSSVFVTSDLRTANQFATYAQDINPGSQAVVLRVDIPEEGLSAVKFDEISDDRMRAYRYNGTIPPAWIRGKVTNTKGGFEALVGAKTIYVVVVADGELRAAEEMGHDFHGNQYTVGYHGTTSSYVDSILSQGLNSDTQGHTYFTKNLGDAKAYANDTASRRGGTPVVLKIKIPRSESSRVVESYPMHLFKGRVPAEWVKVHSTTLEPEFKLKGMATSRETILHSTADSFIPKLQVAIRYAFAQGRKALLAAPNDHDKAARIVHDSLLEVLPTTLLKVLVAGGNAGLGLLDGRLLKVAGGSGSGNFGHVGRPGEIGGSGEGSVYFHGTSERALEKIRKEGLISSDEQVGYGSEHHVYMTPDRELAERYARNHEALNQQDVYTAMIVEIHVPAEHLHEVTPAKTQPADEHLHAVIFPRRIPPEWIGKAYILKKDGGWREAEASDAATHYAVIFIKHDLRAAEDTGHDFHGNQWTSEGGSAGIVFHGTTRARLESILKNGIEPNASATRAEIAEPGKVAFATLNFKEAKAYAVDHNEVPNGVVLEIHVPKGERFSKSYGSSILHRDTAIPASWIKAVHARVDRTGKVYTGGGTGRYSRMGLTWQKIRSLAGDVAEVVYVVVSLGEDDLRAAASIKISFNASDPKAARWARDHAAELAKNLSDTTRQNIKDAVEESVSGDGSRQDILAAVGDSARAELIARTETMIAVHVGQRQGWDQAIDKGLLTGDEQVEWIATSGACPICDELDGELRDLDGEYPDPGGEGPPQHPNCRCTEGITA